jgi:hypothetical protein
VLGVVRPPSLSTKIQVKTQANGLEMLQDFNHTIPPHAVRPPSPDNGKKGNRGSTLDFASPDLPIHPTDCSKTLEMPGSSHGRPLPQRNCTEMLSIMGNRKSRDQTSRTRAPTKTTKSESIPQVWRGKVTKKGTRSSCVTPTSNPAKKRLQNSATKIPRKGSENHQKGT